MKTIIYFFIVSHISLFINACSNHIDIPDKDPAAMLHWQPPSEEDLKLRRLRQKEIDELRKDIEFIMLMMDDFGDPLAKLERSVQSFEPNLKKKETESLKKLQSAGKKLDQQKAKLGQIKGSIKKLESDINAKRGKKYYTHNSYKTFSSAVKLFRNGKYNKSIEKFKQSLLQAPGNKLKDNIYFGMGSAYFKLNRLQQAEKFLNRVVDDYPESDKWFSSSLLLAWVYINNAERSKALFVLDRAMKKNPPERMKQLMEKLYKNISEDDGFMMTSENRIPLYSNTLRVSNG